MVSPWLLRRTWLGFALKALVFSDLRSGQLASGSSNATIQVSPEMAALHEAAEKAGVLILNEASARNHVCASNLLF